MADEKKADHFENLLQDKRIKKRLQNCGYSPSILKELLKQSDCTGNGERVPYIYKKRGP